MFIDVTNAERYKGNDVLPKVQDAPFGTLPEGSLVAADYWDEHCVECGAPLCYKTCEMFRKTPARTCSRFNQGMRPVRLSDGTYGVAVHFRRWGKMELFYKGFMIEVPQAAKLWKRDIRVSALVRFLNKLTSLIVPFGRRTLISAYRHARDKFVMKRFGRKAQSPNTWRIQCYTSQPTSLMAAVANKDGEMFIQKLTLSLGWNKFEFTIPRLESEGYFRVYSIEGTPCSIVFSDLDVLYVPTKAAHAKHVKCVVWDLDNTLWSGILAEDDPQQISLRPVVFDVIKILDGRGIVSSVCSKNDYEPAWRKLMELGVAEYIVFPHINWDPKSANIKHLAKEMNIGIDSLAFVDDSQSERGEVAELCPQVRIYTEQEIDRLVDEEPFNPPVSAESARRRLTYKLEMERKVGEARFNGSHEDFIRSCEIELTLVRVEEDVVLTRCWELVNRTNQLTLAARRYEKEGFEELVESEDCYAIQCKDKYGDYGIIGFIASRKKEVTLEIVEFVMSCRVAKKYCEQSVLLSLAERAMHDGRHSMTADVFPTGRNLALVEAFDKMPFETTQDGGIIKYNMRLTEATVNGLFRNTVRFAE